ncbi:MAG: M20/M25/M40 family metallo-hydrolase [Clostridia bacterium]|nr:M20/M25/M40 family metallo-hydrolase [Clostridia bacterium]
MNMREKFQKFINENEADLYKTLKELCLIPAPAGLEDERAAYCKAKLESFGAEGVYIDEVKNVIYPINAEGKNELTVIAAHTDTVFPDLEPMPYIDDGEKITCPGVGDDTASLAVLLFVAKFLIENDITPERGLLIVCNSCEEGLGNLKGTRRLFADFEGRIKEFISYDASTFKRITRGCVGSVRYEVEVKTEGGHSFGAFGNKNAIYYLSKMVNAIYELEIPALEGEKTTYNVGIIEGGTSVNTIAQSAKMLCEYRSTSADALEIMKGKFYEIFDTVRSMGVEVNVTVVGERPSERGVDQTKVDDLCAIIAKAFREVAGTEEVTYGKGSTDCNIPLSLGIPAICYGVYNGAGAHTRTEWIKRDSIIPGLEIALMTTLDFI